MVLGTNDSNFEYVYNKYSWNVDYNMIFIDNPLGAGLSYAENDSVIPTS